MKNYKGLLIAGIILVMGVAVAIFIVIAAFGIFSKETDAGSSLGEPISYAKPSDMEKLELIFCLTTKQPATNKEAEEAQALPPECIEVNNKLIEQGLELITKLKNRLKHVKDSADKKKALELLNKMVAELNALKGEGNVKRAKQHADEYNRLRELLGQILNKILAQEFKIYLHWTGGARDAQAGKYTYNILSDGTSVYTGGEAHTFARNSPLSAGISVAAMRGGTTDCYTDILGSKCPVPITQKQLDGMIDQAAKLAIQHNIPIDIQHVMTHGEAGSMMDFDAATVEAATKACGLPQHDKDESKVFCYQQRGLPHDNYGPYRDGAFLRWEFYGFENELRSRIQARVNQLKSGGN